MVRFRELLRNTIFESRINLLIDDAKNIWLRNLGKNDFIHSMNVEKNLDRLVPDNIKVDEKIFDKAEIFLLLYAVYLHDIGRVKDVSYHEKETYTQILENPMKFRLQNLFEARAVAEICYGHARESERPIKSIPTNYGIEGFSNRPMNLQFLAALLRLADEMDNAYTRVQGIRDQDESIRNLIRFINFDTSRWIIEIQSEPLNLKDWNNLQIIRKYIQNRLDEIKDILESKDLLYFQILLYPKEFKNISPENNTVVEKDSLIKSLEVEDEQNLQKYILHLSDLHIGSIGEARKYLTQLKADLIKNLNITKLDYLVISGDITNISIQEEYDAALDLVCGLIKNFCLNRDNVIIVPGNHDLNWDLSEKAFDFVSKNKLINLLPEETYIPAGDAGVLIKNDLYRLRFSNFDYFYRKIHNNQYPLEHSEQGILHVYTNNKIIFLALNSCWEIDHYHNRASINMDALSCALDKLIDSKYDDWLKIAVFHHPITGPDMMKNVDFLQQLAVHGFKICMHGHIHEAIEGYHKYDYSRGLFIVGAGTFGAPKREIMTTIPLQYNLLILNPETHTLKVETRKKEKPDGAWFADARWGDLNNPLPRYTISLNK